MTAPTYRPIEAAGQRQHEPDHQDDRSDDEQRVEQQQTQHEQDNPKDDHGLIVPSLTYI